MQLMAISKYKAKSNLLSVLLTGISNKFSMYMTRSKLFIIV